MHQDYSPAAARVVPNLRSRSAAKHLGHSSRRKDDWGKHMPFWCLRCGEGFVSVEQALSHYAEEGHGNESMSVGSRSLTKAQQLEAFKLRNK